MEQKAQSNEAGTGADGKKVFILYPHSVIHEEMLDILIMNGFETYTLRDHKKAVKLLERFSDSIVFINIDDGMPENEWEKYIRALQENPQTKDVKIGILSYNQDKALMEKYLMEIAVPCGYIQLKLGVQESTKIILGALHANEAKGRRKYIRAFCEDDVYATVNYKSADSLYQGKLLDISAAGFAAKISGLAELLANSVLKGMQLKLHGTLIMTDVIFMGKRRDNQDVCILLFDPNKLDQSNKLAIHRYIKQNLQRYIDQLKI